jgi:hypothetical protein
VIIEYEGQRYPFDFDDITVKQAIKIEKHTGMSFGEWGKAIAAGSSLAAVQAVGWLILHGGRDVPIEDCDFKLMQLAGALHAANAAEEAAEKAAAEAAEAAGPRPTGGTSTAPKAAANGAGDLSPASLTAGP